MSEGKTSYKGKFLSSRKFYDLLLCQRFLISSIDVTSSGERKENNYYRRQHPSVRSSNGVKWKILITNFASISHRHLNTPASSGNESRNSWLIAERNVDQTQFRSVPERKKGSLSDGKAEPSGTRMKFNQSSELKGKRLRIPQRLQKHFSRNRR